jgi:hypothetical protein
MAPTRWPCAQHKPFSAVLDCVMVRGYRGVDSPARCRDHLSEVLPAIRKIQKTKHHPALPIDDVQAFMSAVREQQGVAARALECDHGGTAS